MFCVQCGQTLVPDAPYCAHCGSRAIPSSKGHIEQTGAAEQASTVEQTTSGGQKDLPSLATPELPSGRRAPGRRPLLMGGGVVAALIVIGLVAVLASGGADKSKPKATAHTRATTIAPDDNPATSAAPTRNPEDLFVPLSGYGHGSPLDQDALHAFGTNAGRTVSAPSGEQATMFVGDLHAALENAAPGGCEFGLCPLRTSALTPTDLAGDTAYEYLLDERFGIVWTADGAWEVIILGQSPEFIREVMAALIPAYRSR